MEQLEDDLRKTKLKEIREIILLNGLGLTEDIEYKMLCYHHGHISLFHLNAQKNCVSLYLGNIDKINGSRKRFNMGA